MNNFLVFNVSTRFFCTFQMQNNNCFGLPMANENRRMSEPCQSSSKPVHSPQPPRSQSAAPPPLHNPNPTANFMENTDADDLVQFINQVRKMTHSSIIGIIVLTFLYFSAGGRNISAKRRIKYWPE